MKLIIVTKYYHPYVTITQADYGQSATLSFGQRRAISLIYPLSVVSAVQRYSLPTHRRDKLAYILQTNMRPREEAGDLYKQMEHYELYKRNYATNIFFDPTKTSLSELHNANYI